MNSKVKKIAVAIAVTGLAALGAGVPSSAQAAPARHMNIWCC